MNEGRIEENAWERRFYEMALKCSGAVQAARWSNCKDGGYICSFNGPHSLFVDTIRTIRALAVAHQLGHALSGENDRRISLLDRLLLTCFHWDPATRRYGVYVLGFLRAGAALILLALGGLLFFLWRLERRRRSS